MALPVRGASLAFGFLVVAACSPSSGTGESSPASTGHSTSGAATGTTASGTAAGSAGSTGSTSTGDGAGGAAATSTGVTGAGGATTTTSGTGGSSGGSSSGTGSDAGMGGASGAGGGGGAAPDAGAPSAIVDRIDWASFFARHDLTWSALPTGWSDGAFIGDGLVGAMVSRDGTTANVVRWRIGRTDIYDARPLDFVPLLNDPAFWHARLPVGDLKLTTVGKISGGTLRLDLYNAEVTGTITTDQGTIKLRSFAHASEPVVVVELTSTGAESGATWSWVGADAVSSRVAAKPPAPDGYMANPPGMSRTVGTTSAWEQTLLGGGGYATAWQEKTTAGKRQMFVSVDIDRQTSAVTKAVQHVTSAMTEGVDVLAASHRTTWHDLYRNHFLSIPDGRFESFYWIQIYKLASAVRSDGPVLDLMGPWYDASSWPAVWWNLNVQLSYYPIYVANLLPLGNSMLTTIESGVANLKRNIPADCNDCLAFGRITGLAMLGGTGGTEVGHMTWALHSAYMVYRHSMDESLLRNRIFPLLRRNVNYYLYLLKKEADGKLHLPSTNSPEYGNTTDANYDLFLLHWALQTLIATSDRLALADPLVATWKDTLANLTPYPVDASGLRVGRDLAFAMSHRHYSHMLGVFPLHVLDWDNPTDRTLIQKSYDTWSGLRSAWRGYSWTGATSFSSIFGKGNDALTLMQTFLDEAILPNTLYSEGSPVIETPPSGARSIQDMLFGSWGGILRVFPAVPDAWKDVVIHDFGAEGAFRVSAVRKAGVTQFVRVKSLAGEPCRVRTDLAKPFAIQAPRAIAMTEQPDGSVVLDLKKGEEAVLTTMGKAPDLSVSALPAGAGWCANYYAQKKCGTVP